MRNETILILSDLEENAKKVEKFINSENVTFDAILGAIGEEYESQSIKDVLQEVYLSSFSHADLENDYLNKPSSTKRGFSTSLSNLMQNDIGPGNINIRTAIDLLHKYKKNMNGKDNLNLLPYLDDYSKLVKDMSDKNKIITPALVGLYLKEAERVVEKSTAWKNINSNEKKLY